MSNIPEAVLSRDSSERGRPTGGIRECQMEGCTGTRIGVRWPDGKLTWPCTKGMKWVDEETIQIL